MTPLLNRGNPMTEYVEYLKEVFEQFGPIQSSL